MIALRLSKAGYGTPTEILNEGFDVVLGMLVYEDFSTKYEESFLALNKDNS